MQSPCFGIAVGDDHGQSHFLGALGGLGRFNPAGHDQQRLAHQKYNPPFTLIVCAVM